MYDKRKTAMRKTRGKSSSSGAAARDDAIALLKADHRQVGEWFEQFQASRSESKKRELAQVICKALTVQ